MLVLYQRMFLNSSLQTRQTFRKVSNLLEIKTSHFTTVYLDPPISHYVSPPEVGQPGLLRSPLFIANLSSVPKSQKNKKKTFFENQMPHIWPPFVTRRIDIVCFLLPRNRTPKWPASYLWSGIIYSRSVLKSSSSHIWLHFAGGKSIFFRHVRAPPCFFSFLLCFVPARAVRQMETINSSRFYCRAAGPPVYGEIGCVRFTIWFFCFFFAFLRTMTGICL